MRRGREDWEKEEKRKRRRFQEDWKEKVGVGCAIGQSSGFPISSKTRGGTPGCSPTIEEAMGEVESFIGRKESLVKGAGCKKAFKEGVLGPGGRRVLRTHVPLMEMQKDPARDRAHVAAKKKNGRRAFQRARKKIFGERRVNPIIKRRKL